MVIAAPVTISPSQLPAIEQPPSAPPSTPTSAPTSAPLPLDPLAEEQYIDVEVLEQQMKQRESERFYLLPDGGGGRQVVTAGVLAGTARPTPATEPSTSASWRACGTPPPLPHLLIIPDQNQQHSLVFPVVDPRYPGTRFAGYSLALPAAATRARVLAIVRAGVAADIAVVLLDGAGRPVAAVNNIATESIPEKPFSYAMVGGNVPLSGHAGAGYRLALMEAPWARKVLPEACRPEPVERTAVAGRVSVEFTQEGSKPR